jgi:hypothetical protein
VLEADEPVVAPPGRKGFDPDLFLQIRRSAAVQTERIQAIIDGAILAVEQVQDKRLDVLETPPEVEMSDAIFDMLLGICLGAVAEHVLKPITESIVSNVITSAAYYSKVPESGAPKSLEFLTAKLGTTPTGRKEVAEAQAMAVTRGALRRGLEVKADDIAKYNKYLRKQVVEIGEKLGEKAAEKVAEKFKEAPEMLEGVGKEGPSELQPTDTPGVAILGAAQTYASNNRAAIARHHSAFEVVLHRGASADELQMIDEATQLGELEDELIAIRDKHKIFFEAAIWAKLFRFDVPEKITADARGNVQLVGVNTLLKAYWNHRFAQLIQEWVQGSKAANLGLDPIRAPFESLDRNKQTSYVNRFFAALAKELAGLAPDAMKIHKEPVSK